MAYIAIDGGGTNLRVARFTDEGIEEGRLIVDSNTEDYRASLGALSSSIHELFGDEKPSGIGVSIAGNTDGHVVLGAGNLKGFINKSFAQDLRDIHKCPVWLFNDGQAMGASEYETQKRPLILAIWGSGVNFAVVLDDGIFYLDGRGSSIIGEGGHQEVEYQGRPCGCGQYGCLEAYTGGTALKSIYGRPAEELNEDEWAEVRGFMAQGLRNIIAFTGGRLPIFFAGGVACGQEHQLPILRDALGPIRTLLPNLPMISLVTRGADAGLDGASLITRRQLKLTV